MEQIPKEVTTLTDSYEFDTTLSGGYSLSFGTDDSMDHLYLRKANHLTRISSNEKGLPHKNLGFIAFDFLDFFALAHSFGSGNPPSIELIEKKTGKNIIEDGSLWIDIDESNQLLLYTVSTSPDEEGKMILYNINTRKREIFDFPDDVVNQPMGLSRIKISEVNINYLIIAYETEDSTVKQSFPCSVCIPQK